MFINQKFTTKEQEVKVCSFKKCVSRKELDDLIAFLNINKKIIKSFEEKRKYYLNNDKYCLTILQYKNEKYKIELRDIDIHLINNFVFIYEGDYLVKFSSLNNQIKAFSKEEFEILFKKSIKK